MEFSLFLFLILAAIVVDVVRRSFARGAQTTELTNQKDLLRTVTRLVERVDALERRIDSARSTPVSIASESLAEPVTPSGSADENRTPVEPVAAAMPAAPVERPKGSPPPLTMLGDPRKRVPPPVPSARAGALSASDFEKRAGQRWTTWIGVLVIAIGVGLFIKYAIDHNLLSPITRLILGQLVAMVFLIAGEAARRYRYLPLAQGLLAAGLLSSQASIFAAYRFHEVLSQSATFTALSLVVGVGLLLAVAFDFQAIAILSLIGGMLNPALVSSSEGSRDALFSYVFLLDVGVLVILYRRRWDWLDAVAMFATWAWYGTWMGTTTLTGQREGALYWLLAFDLVFLAIPLMTILRWSEPAHTNRLTVAVVHSLAFLGAGWWLFDQVNEYALAYLAFVQSVAHVSIMAAAVSLRRPRDDRFETVQIALAVGLFTVALPLYFDVNGFTLAWSVEAPLLLLIGWMYRDHRLRFMAALVEVLALLESCSAIESLSHGPWPRLVDATMARALIPAASALIFAWIHDRYRALHQGPDGGLMAAAGVASAIVPITTFWVDATNTFGRLGTSSPLDAHGHEAGIVVLLVGGAVLWIFGMGRASIVARVTAMAVGFAAIAQSLVLLSTPVNEPFQPIINTRFGAVSAVALMPFLLRWARIRFQKTLPDDETIFANAFLVMAVILSWMLCTCEAYQYFEASEGDRPFMYRRALAAVSVVWSIYAVALVGSGLAARQQWVRLAGLGLFALTLFKVVIFDLSELEDLNRIFAFIGLGLMLMATSYLYHRLEKRLART